MAETQYMCTCTSAKKMNGMNSNSNNGKREKKVQLDVEVSPPANSTDSSLPLKQTDRNTYRI